LPRRISRRGFFCEPARREESRAGSIPIGARSGDAIGSTVILCRGTGHTGSTISPALFTPKLEAIAAAPARAETLAREADEATKTAFEAKSAAAIAAREAAPLMASLRKLKVLKTDADTALALAEKALAAAKTDQAKARAEELEEKAAAKVAGAADAARHCRGQREA
jgi:hypothetical protein